MKYTLLPLLLLATCLAPGSSYAQQAPLSASAGLGPGDSFTLFITFEDPMPNVVGAGCAFGLRGSAKPGQEDFVKSLRCTGSPVKDDDKHYHMKVAIPQDVAEGDYDLVWISVAVDAETSHQYQAPQLPSLAPVKITNPKKLEFSPIKKLDVKP